MKLYFSTRSIPELKGQSLPQRIQALEKASGRLTGPEKMLLNVIKLLIIVPVFVFILQSSEDWRSLIWALLFSLCYPLLLKPIQHSLCVKYLKKTDDKVN